MSEMNKEIDVVANPSSDFLKDMRIVRSSGLFDEHWYESQYKIEQPDLVRHFLHEGSKKGMNPNRHFDVNFYLKENADVKESGINPLVHYILIGNRENRSVHPGLNINLAEYTRDVLLIEQAGLIDADWYLRNYRDVEKSGLGACEHYCLKGFREGKDPCPYFDTAYYLGTNPDVAQNGMNPLLHYLQYGHLEHRYPHPDITMDITDYKKWIQTIKSSGLFDLEWFLISNPDIRESGIDPVEYYYFYGVKKGCNPNPYFDTTYYLESYPDVAASGMNPLLHYIRYGAGEHRDTHPDQRIKNLLPPTEFKRFGLTPLSQMLWFNLNDQTGNYAVRHPNSGTEIYKVVGSETEEEFEVPDLDSENGYRVNPKTYTPLRVVYILGQEDASGPDWQIKDQLRALNECQVKAGWIGLNEMEKSIHQLAFAEVIVLYHVPFREDLVKVLDQCRKAGVLIVYQDDFSIFNPKQTADAVHEKKGTGKNSKNKEDKKRPSERLTDYSGTLKYAGFGIFSTNQLAEQARKTGIDSFVIHKGISDEIRKLSDEAWFMRTKEPIRKTVNLGIVTKAFADESDINRISDSLVRMFKKYPDVKLVIVGLFDLSKHAELGKFKSQIEIRPPAGRLDMPGEIARFDIYLAPNEAGNFSEEPGNKYNDAALLRVPTISIPGKASIYPVASGENGGISFDEEDWFTMLSVLIEDKVLRKETGENAFVNAIAQHGSVAQKHGVFTTFNKLFRIRKENLTEIHASLNQTITFMVPGMEKGGGGHAIVLDMAKWLVKWGHTVTLAFTDKSADYSDASTIEKEFKFDTSRMRACFSKRVPGDTNISFSTFWTTVYLVDKSDKLIGRKYHMLLDYEPFFYPMSTYHILALNSYYRNFRKISWSPWIKNLLLKWHRIDNVRTFPLYFNRNIYNTNGSVKRSNKKIVFFGRPTMPRRCFDLGIEVLTRYRELYGNKVEIVFYGSLALETANIPFKHTRLGVLTPAQLADLYKEAALGIAFSITNPSKVPFEMMACGLPVLDLNTEGNDANYGNDSHTKNVFLFNPDVEEMAEGINSILIDDILRSRVAQNGNKFVSGFADEEGAAQILFDHLLTDSIDVQQGLPQACS
jgi:glycosyltransferase involved in cell wall biosynthesis